ncbi:UNVERIFIED_CONTAM: hypothetical protein HDU68_004148 [Siphonaria sp. JEL0065]|nr:hypothetical protein HDU68_004148 [Siphonaria sp. JEL0065]
MEYDLSYDEILLIGDSLTELSILPDGWGTLLAQKYSRKMQVITRGFSAYTSYWLLPAIRPLIKNSVKHPKLITLLIGTNDSTIKGKSRQHVPLEMYRENIFALVKTLKDFLPDAKLLLITPPLLGDHVLPWEEYELQSVKKYRDVCLEVGLELSERYENVGLLDTWELFVPGKEYESVDFDPTRWRHLFWDDMLHLGKEGNALLEQGVLETVRRLWPQLAPENVKHKLSVNWQEAPTALDGDAEGVERFLFQNASTFER